MSKEGKEPNSDNIDQGDALSNSEFGFVYEFFISEDKSGGIEKTARGQQQEKRESELKAGDQSVTFFLPDFFTDET